MQKNTASRTALATAYLRAAHQVLDSRPLVLDDPVALALLGPDAEAKILASRDTLLSALPQALRAHVVLRSRYAEDRLAAARQRGIAQYILLGAGFDTFAWRQPAWAQAELTLYEVDHPDTQADKRTRLDRAGLQPPANLRWVDLDFETETLPARLARAGVRPELPTFFSWLGVTMYLSEPAIDATLRTLAGFAPGSEAVITFLQASEAPSAQEQSLTQQVSSLGEPFVSRFSTEAFVDKLRSSGFAQVEVLTPQQSAPLFPRDGTLSNPERIGIVSARV